MHACELHAVRYWFLFPGNGSDDHDIGNVFL